MDTNKINYLNINIIDDSILYLKYEYLNFEVLKLLEKNNMVTSLPKIEHLLKLCDIHHKQVIEESIQDYTNKKSKAMAWFAALEYIWFY